MSDYHGDISVGSTIDIQFPTKLNGVMTTLSGSPAISAYVDNGTTEITAGITLTVDFDGRTGQNNVRVVASGGNGFASATNVSLVITTGTVGGVSVVGHPVGAFSIDNRNTGSGLSAAATRAALGMASADLDTQLGGISSKTTNLPAAPASTTNITAGTITTVTNLTNAPTAGDLTATMKTSVGTAVAASAVASVTGNVGGDVTGSVGSVVGAVGSVTGNVGGNVVGSVASVSGAVGSVTATVNADVKKINAVTITGAGTSGNEFQP
jgi:hypothetical protein